MKSGERLGHDSKNWLIFKVNVATMWPFWKDIEACLFCFSAKCFVQSNTYSPDPQIQNPEISLCCHTHPGVPLKGRTCITISFVVQQVGVFGGTHGHQGELSLPPLVKDGHHLFHLTVDYSWRRYLQSLCMRCHMQASRDRLPPEFHGSIHVAFAEATSGHWWVSLGCNPGETKGWISGQPQRRTCRG